MRRDVMASPTRSQLTWELNMSQGKPPTGRVITQFEVVLDEYLARQRTLLRLIDFMDLNGVSLDDQRAIIVDRLTKRYRNVDSKAIHAVADIFAVLEASSEDRGADKADIEKRIAEAQELMPEGYGVTALISDAMTAVRDGPGVPLLYSSMLASMVGNFEMLIARLVRMAYQRNPQLADLSERKFTWQEVAAYDSLDSFKESVIEQVTDKLIRASFDTWLDHFEKKLGAKVPSSVRGAEVREVFQRRNIVVHNGGHVSTLYLENMADLKSPPELGAKLEVDSTYLNTSADHLAVLALHLVWQIGRRRLKGEELAGLEMFVCDVPYQSLRDGRMSVAERQAEHLLDSGLDREKNALYLRVNFWLAKKRQGNFGSCADEVRKWQTGALSPEFELARLALIDDLDRGLSLAVELRGTKPLSMKSWHTWPLLEELREHERRARPPRAIAGGGTD